MPSVTKYQLSDEFIGQLIKLIQFAMMSQTDIGDQLRIMTLTAEDEKLVLTPEYYDQFNRTMNEMVEKIEKIQAQVKP